MNSYRRGHEPPCPKRLPGCLGIIRTIGCQSCKHCETKGRKLGSRETLQGTGDICEITKTVGQRVRSLEDLIRVCDIDTTSWEIERYVCNKWDMGSVPRATGNKEDGWKLDSAEPVVTELYQVKVWLRRKVEVLAARAEIESLLADAKKRMPLPRKLPKVAKAPADYMLELSIPDLHAGKLAWSPETGHANYDAKIAERLYLEAVETLLARTAGYRFSKVVLVVGNDLFHIDSKSNQTTSGTQMDADGRFHKTFGIVRRMMTQVIEMRLRPVAPVDVYVVPGNHDTMAAWHLGDSLDVHFAKHPDVTIHNAPTMRKYHQFGKVMLMFTHGNAGKRADYPLLMATEQPEMFGSTTHREAHTGHNHQTKAEEFHGVRVRVSPALCPPDAWHSEHTFVGNKRAGEAYIWSREQGLVGTAIFTVPEPK